MQKSILLILSVILAIHIPAFAQNNKIKVKYAAGQTKINFSPININGRAGLKSANTFYINPGLQPPIIKKTKLHFDKIINTKNGPVYFEIKRTGLKSAPIENISSEKTFNSFMESVNSVINTNNQHSFEIKETQTDELGMIHIRSVQKYKGIPVYGSESGLHISSEKIRFTGNVHNIDQDIDTNPAFTTKKIISIATSDLENETVLTQLSSKQKEILNYEFPECNLIIFKNEQGSYNLAYEIEIRPNFLEVWKYFINAKTGNIIRKFNSTFTDGPVTTTALDLNDILQNINTYLENDLYYLVNTSEDMFNASTGEGMIQTFDANSTSTTNLDYSFITSTDNQWNHPAAISAHYNATITYQYFRNTFNRNSINGQGGSIISLVNVANNDGSSMSNAFWNGKAVFYGNGGDDSKPLAGALDVSAHELGHGVISSTARLEYYEQSGAINESFADIFGSMVDRDDWLIGEDITLNGQPMRSMQNPANGKNSILDGWQPKHMSELVNGDDLDYFVNRDNEGVHINSGIGNYAYYLYATNISKDKAEQVYYRALKEYLNKLSKFIDLRIAVVQSAKDLFGDNSPEAIKASEAFDAVGIYEEEQIDYTQDYEENPGQEYLISYDTNEMDENTLYQSSAEGTDFAAITTTDMKGKVSISDDGTVAVFVSKDHKIRAIDLNTFNEVILSDDPFWDNVAISKDGKRLAGISTEIDTAIYVYDFISQQWTKYILYNPTTSNDNSNSGGVLYADVIEFDQTGEYLIYDAYNYLNSNTSEDIYYWDIGFINIWNNKENSFGNGKISKLYESLRENVSIGNPVFSKNSPYIIAFDFFDEKNDEFAIIGANLIDGEIEDIYLNSILGYPSFSTNDNYIAFSALNTSEEEVVAKIGLAENKISGTGSASAIINSAKWPVFYASGQRLLGLKPTSNFTADIKAGNAPLKIIFFDLSINNPTSWKWSFERGSPNISNEQNPEISYNTPGLYNVTLTTQNPYGSDTKKKTSYILISKSSGVKEVNLNSVQFFPNPVNDILTIISGENFSVSLYDLNRKEIIHEKNRTSLDLSGLNSGIYILEVICEKQVIREKILKQ